MLIQLKIENIALIEIIEINFEKGLNITGDSGSGKSLILDSLNALFGGLICILAHKIFMASSLDTTSPVNFLFDLMIFHLSFNIFKVIF